MDLVTQFIDPVEAAMRAGVEAGYMVTVVGKLLARGEAGCLADDLISFDDQPRAVGVFDNPLSSEERDRPVGAISDGDEINERVRLVDRQTHAAVMIGELIEPGSKAG